MASWIVVALLLRLNATQLREVIKKTWRQMWGACLVGVFIFGLAFVFNFSGHGRIACLRVLQNWEALVHHCSAHSWLDWRRALRQQYLNKRHVRRIPVRGR
jgi:hypothetical protein